MTGAVSHSPLVPQPDTSRRPEQNKKQQHQLEEVDVPRTHYSMMDDVIPDKVLLDEVLVLNFKETILAAARDGTLDDLYPDVWDDDDDYFLSICKRR